MEINGRPNYEEFKIARDLVEILKNQENFPALFDSKLYFDFPLYRDEYDNPISAKILLLSPHFGGIIIWPYKGTKIEPYLEKIKKEIRIVKNLIISRLYRNDYLTEKLDDLKSLIDFIIFAPILDEIILPEDIQILKKFDDLTNYFSNKARLNLSDRIYIEFFSSIEGSRSIIKKKARVRDTKSTKITKGNVVIDLENSIAQFDHDQKNGYMIIPEGPMRIRGLAGSGKTVILAIKAAFIHLRFPEARIVYTFLTRTLYQLVRSMIQRFYRQWTDKEPNWDKILIMHSWGGTYTPGVYYKACSIAGAKYLTYKQALSLSQNPFDYVCKILVDDYEIPPVYDYILIDEGQDFPASFLKLCSKLTKNNRFVLAYDDAQTIFQYRTPTPAEYFGTNDNGEPLLTFQEDIILHKCYRNPREILVCAHALGLGIYGEQMVQTFEEKEYWEDIGYILRKGELKPGIEVLFERPAENSLDTISRFFTKDEIVQAFSFQDMEEEIHFVAEEIQKDLTEGLRPDDILVICVDDRHAKQYLSDIEEKLEEKNIKSNNLQSEKYGILTFMVENCVSLSTVYKAKGNESYSVYVVGVDFLFIPSPDVIKRNTLFSAITRAKGWVKVSGVGDGAEICKNEIHKALDNFPNLIFNFPSPSEMKVMRRDLKNEAIRKQNAARKIDEALGELSFEEIQKLLEQRKAKSSKRTPIDEEIE